GVPALHPSGTPSRDAAWVGKLPVNTKKHPPCQVAGRQMQDGPRHPGRWAKLATSQQAGHGRFSPPEVRQPINQNIFATSC
ncbi:MAG: hypothetical protein ACKOB0_02185, partial [Chthoniobacterales bacterium]